jgi:hypothetical protein
MVRIYTQYKMSSIQRPTSSANWVEIISHLTKTWPVLIKLKNSYLSQILCSITRIEAHIVRRGLTSPNLAHTVLKLLRMQLHACHVTKGNIVGRLLIRIIKLSVSRVIVSQDMFAIMELSPLSLRR